MSALHELAGDLLKAEEALREMDDLPPEAVADTLEGFAGPFEEKVVAVAKMVENLRQEAEAIDALAKRQADRAKARRKKAESLEGYLLGQLDRVGTAKVETAELCVKRRKNPPSVEVVAEGDVPEAFFIQPPPPPVPAPRLDKKAVLEVLKAGEEVPGCRLATRYKLVIE
ncbi:MAG: siphovirus Gp157 family protein [Halomonas sp.]